MSFLLIDANSLCWAAQSATRLSANGMAVHAIFHTLKMVKTAIKTNPEYKTPVVIWDGHAQFRYDLYPEYKGKRSEDPKRIEAREELALQKPEIIKAFDLLGLPQIHPTAYEADDVAGYMVRKATKDCKKSLLVSGDRDWLQLVNSLTSWYDPRSNGTSVIGKSEFKAFTGFDRINQFIEAKAILGDSSDEIKGVPGLGEKAVEAIMEKFGSILGMMNDHKANGPFAKRKDLDKSLSRFRKPMDALCSSRDVQAIYVRNVKLMRLTDDSKDGLIKEDVKLSRKTKDLDAFQDFCGHHKFASILRELPTWNF